MPKKAFIVPEDAFRHYWRCVVVTSGFHNGAYCSPDDPHDASTWGCGYVYSLTVRDFARFKTITIED